MYQITTDREIIEIEAVSNVDACAKLFRHDLQLIVKRKTNEE